MDRKFLAGQQPQIYLGTLYKAIFITAYYGLLRIGEVAKGDHPVLTRDVRIGINKKKLLFILRTSKTHNKSDIPQTVKVTSSDQLPTKQEQERKRQADPRFCPYNLLREYLLLRPAYVNDTEQFFVFRDRSPVKTAILSRTLKNILHGCKIDNSKFSFHGFRAGRGVDFLKLGVSVETIKKIGRWKSNAVFNYLNKFN